MAWSNVATLLILVGATVACAVTGHDNLAATLAGVAGGWLTQNGHRPTTDPLTKSGT